MYICQSYFTPLIPSIRVCSLCLCLYFCFANKFICIIFLYYKHKGYHLIFIFLILTYFTLYDSLLVHSCLCKRHNFIPFYSWVIFHCIYVPYFLYAFLCWWTFSLLPCPGYCKWCCSEHWGYIYLFFLFFSFYLFIFYFLTIYHLFMIIFIIALQY